MWPNHGLPHTLNSNPFSTTYGTNGQTFPLWLEELGPLLALAVSPLATRLEATFSGDHSINWWPRNAPHLNHKATISLVFLATLTTLFLHQSHSFSGLNELDHLFLWPPPLTQVLESNISYYRPFAHFWPESTKRSLLFVLATAFLGRSVLPPHTPIGAYFIALCPFARGKVRLLNYWSALAPKMSLG